MKLLTSIITAGLLSAGFSAQAIAASNGTWRATERCVNGVCTGSATIRLNGKDQEFNICYANGHRYYKPAGHECY